MSATPEKPFTRDIQNRIVQAGDKVRILGVSMDADLEDDERDMIDFMVGSVCEVDRVDADGCAWVTMWWNCAEGVATTTVALSPAQIEREAADTASR